MCTYKYLLKYSILLLIVNCSAAVMDDELIATTEELINQNNTDPVLKLETKVEAERSETHMTVYSNQLAACQAQIMAKDEHFTTLNFSCSISFMDNEDQYQAEGLETQREIELKSQLKLKDHEILELQIKLQAAQSKLKAYDNQWEEFQPSSCLPFGSTTGIYRIKLPALASFYAPCDARIAGSGWLVIQRRMDGSVNFYRNWRDYQAGFGALNGEFFIGLEKLHRLTAQQPYELYVHLEDFEGEIRYAHYDNFSIGSEKSFYELSSLGQYDGNAGNSMGLNVRQKFSTLDSDNDSWQEGSCARRYHSAWWYASCAAFCNPNGKYFKRRQLDSNSRGKGIIWQHWHGFEEALKFVQLMIRPISTANY